MLRSLPNGSNYKSGTSECVKKIETHDDYAEYVNVLRESLGFGDDGVVVSLTLLSEGAS
jgi:hypothetical protein